MRHYFLTFLVSLFISIQVFAQQEGPKIIYLINEKIVTEADINTLNPERIKSMDKNISAELNKISEFYHSNYLEIKELIDTKLDFTGRTKF